MELIATLIIPFNACRTNHQNMRGLNFFTKDTKFMNGCSCIIHFKQTSAFLKVFIKCIIYFDELEEASSSSF